jgi:hypothetical protein
MGFVDFYYLPLYVGWVIDEYFRFELTDENKDKVPKAFKNGSLSPECGYITDFNTSKLKRLHTVYIFPIIYSRDRNGETVAITDGTTEMETCLFPNRKTFNENIEEWDVSNVVDMTRAFMDLKEFNQPLNKWNVSNATKMVQMCLGCDTFNQPLDNWNVSKVIDMCNAFAYCLSFNRPLDKWNISSVKNTEIMFYDCFKFNQPLNSWILEGVKTTYMFGGINSMEEKNYPLNLNCMAR